MISNTTESIRGEDSSMIILVTGDTGFIGSHMKNVLSKRGTRVIGYSRSKGFNVLDNNKLRDVAKKVDLIYHFAAEAKPGQSVLRPMHSIEVNVKGTLNVLEVCRELDLPFIYPSSCEIYGDSDEPITEDHVLKPPNPYAASKAALDRICYTYYKCYSLDIKIVRLFNPYGPRQQLNKVMPTFYFQATKNKPLTVYGKGTDTRDYVYIDDVTDGLWLARNLPSGEAVNLATGRSTSNLDLAKLIIKLTKSKSKINFADYPNAFGGIKRQVGSCEKAKRLLGWKAKTPLQEGLKKTLQWLARVKA